MEQESGHNEAGQVEVVSDQEQRIAHSEAIHAVDVMAGFDAIVDGDGRERRSDRREENEHEYRVCENVTLAFLQLGVDVGAVHARRAYAIALVVDRVARHIRVLVCVRASGIRSLPRLEEIIVAVAVVVVAVVARYARCSAHCLFLMQQNINNACVLDYIIGSRARSLFNAAMNSKCS